jgi:2-amino-4-hydroxy-6-hydroxymethyldihydropteridine diphosphokinase
MAFGSEMTGATVNLDDAVFVALGANLSPAGGSCVGALEAAMGELSRRGVAVLARSRPWCSAAWPDPAQPPFVNAVCRVETARDPAALLALLHAVEAGFGRRRGVANAARTLDLDLIAYGRRVEAGPPTLPHPRAAERLFVMGPLAEIAPDWRDPLSGRTALALARDADVGGDAQPAGAWPDAAAWR